MSKAVLGERILLNRDAVPVPVNHRMVPHLLSAVAAISVLFIIWGVFVVILGRRFFGIVMAYLETLWFSDRMVSLWQDIQDPIPEYRSWQIP